MATVLILGYGNTLRGDDGLGPRAAEELRRRLASPCFDVRALHQLTPELADDLAAVSAVLFIDASAEGSPGELSVRQVTVPADAVVTHQMTPGALMALTESLGGSIPIGFALSIAGESFDLSEKLSPIVEAGLPALLEAAAGLAEALGTVGTLEITGSCRAPSPPAGQLRARDRQGRSASGGKGRSPRP
jgi:hydrogenase maturation protease